MNLTTTMPDDNPNQQIDRARAEGEEIPTPEWQRFLEGFSLNHDGWIATVEVAGTDGTSRVAVNSRPFGGISAELTGRADARVVIAFDEDPDNHFAHTIVGPRSIVLFGDTADDLIIEAHDGSRTIVRFVEARNPGKPSGIADAA